MSEVLERALVDLAEHPNSSALEISRRLGVLDDRRVFKALDLAAYDGKCQRTRTGNGPWRWEIPPSSRPTRIKRTGEALNHVVRCGTCTGPDGGMLVLTPGGADQEGRDPDRAARAHVIANPGHEVSMSYGVEVHYHLVQVEERQPKPLIGPGSIDGGK